MIELSIVLVIIGLLFVPMVKAYDQYQAQRRLSDTRGTIVAVNEAIANYYAENGRYPCPADRSLGYGETGHGVERCTAGGTTGPFINLGVGSCDGARDRGFCKAAGQGGEPVYIGAVPYATLDIPGASSLTGSQTIDGWKNKLVYVVTGRLTRVADFQDTGGAIILVDEHDQPIRDPNTNAIVYPHGLLLSAGTDGMGAFNPYGIEIPCDSAFPNQSENCDNDAKFVDSIRYDAPGPTYYDDFTSIGYWSSASIWAYSPVNTDNVYNTNPGNIGIGTNDPQEKLDVVGNIRARDMNAQQYCNTSGDDCFPSATIGGEGIHCPGNQVMIGIRRNSPVCQDSRYNVEARTCNTAIGEVVTGIVNGRVQCAVVP